MALSSPHVLTIGHSNHELAAFRALLHQHQVSAIADVRSAPYSRRYPHFNKERLQASLQREGIAYVFLGVELGARTRDPACYVNGRVQYDRRLMLRFRALSCLRPASLGCAISAGSPHAHRCCR